MPEYIALCVQKIKQHLNIVDEDHGYEHAINVYSHAIEALKYESLEREQQESILLACLLHDCDDHKLFQTQNNQNSRDILKSIQYPQPEIVITMISLISASQNKNTIPNVPRWYLIPRDCDRLEAIGKIGIERCLQYAKRKNLPMTTVNTSKVTTEEELFQVATQERFNNYTTSVSVIDHFYDKLLHIHQMSSCNKYLDEEAKCRHKLMVKFVLDYWCN